MPTSSVGFKCCMFAIYYDKIMNIYLYDYKIFICSQNQEKGAPWRCAFPSSWLGRVVTRRNQLPHRIQLLRRNRLQRRIQLLRRNRLQRRLRLQRRIRLHRSSSWAAQSSRRHIHLQRRILLPHRIQLRCSSTWAVAWTRCRRRSTDRRRMQQHPQVRGPRRLPRRREMSVVFSSFVSVLNAFQDLTSRQASIDALLGRRFQEMPPGN